MLKSMTGFGRGKYEEENFSIVIEIKSVNHRFNEVAIRAPHFLNGMEDRIRREITSTVSRGRMDVFVTAVYTSPDAYKVTVDKPLAAAYHQALQELGSVIGAGELALNEQAEILHLSRLPDVLNVQEGDFDVDAYWPKVKEALDEALALLVAMRETEGGNIGSDFIKRADLIEEKLKLIEARSPQVVEEYKVKLEDRLNKILQDNSIKVDPDRMLQEVAIFADRTSITEECVRLHSHLKQFREILQAPEPVGRKLDFLIQEFNREANTIASKCSDCNLAQVVVEMKAEIEKIREQIQNIE